MSTRRARTRSCLWQSSKSTSTTWISCRTSTSTWAWDSTLTFLKRGKISASSITRWNSRSWPITSKSSTTSTCRSRKRQKRSWAWSFLIRAKSKWKSCEPKLKKRWKRSTWCKNSFCDTRWRNSLIRRRKRSSTSKRRPKPNRGSTGRCWRQISWPRSS